MIKVVIIDDEVNAQGVLQNTINRYFPNKFSVVAICGSVSQGVEAINRLEPELVFLDISATQEKRKVPEITITPEFGPFPYMPQEPFTQKPLSNQWETNIEMKNYLQHNLKTNG